MIEAPLSWHFISGEYPPQPGGVSDYTQRLADAVSTLAEEVHVWTPGTPGIRHDGRVNVHTIRGFGPLGLRRLSAELGAISGPKRLFLQYVAPSLGLRGLNVFFCLWLAARSTDDVWVQFHEVAHGFEWANALRHNALAAVQWWMARLVAERAQRIFVSIPGWRRQLGRYAERAEVLPIPSNVPEEVTESDVASVKARLGPVRFVGHFGTYGRSVTALLEPAVVAVLRSTQGTRFLFVGRGGSNFAVHLAARYPDIASRVVATGALEAAGIAAHIAACDLLLQPYPDGISGRRTTAMAGLALGKPIVTTTGHLTEGAWKVSEAVVLVPTDRTDQLPEAVIHLLSSQPEREALSIRAQAWYRANFSISATIERLFYYKASR